MNETHLDRYARILVEHGAGVAKGREAFVRGDVAHRDLALRVAEAAYDCGARAVRIHLNDPLENAQMIRRASPEQIDLYRRGDRLMFEEAVRSRGAMITLKGDELPTQMQELARDYPESYAAYTRMTQTLIATFHAHGVNRGLCPWVVAGAVTPGWARRVFPGLDEAEATERLWEHVFHFTHADREDAVEAAAEKDRLLHARRRELDALGIREIHVFGGGTDLTVGFCERARWLGGSKKTADGTVFNANVPSEENFTTPDRRATRGRLVATMPFRLASGAIIHDLVLHFEDGRVTGFDAGEGKELFAGWIATDDGARYLGEFALVGQDSPIAQSGLFFEHTLYDENAWSHLALGRAYTSAIEGGTEMSASELEAVGCNTSTIHTDIMFGSKEVTIVATKSREGEVVLLERGEWSERFCEPPTSSGR